MTLLTQTEYALHRGVGKSYISKKNIKKLLEAAYETDPQQITYMNALAKAVRARSWPVVWSSS